MEKFGPKKKRKKVKFILRDKTIITTYLGIDGFLCISHYKTTKEMGDTLQVTHESKNEVKWVE